jgi:hypothetical protein
MTIREPEVPITLAVIEIETKFQMLLWGIQTHLSQWNCDHIGHVTADAIFQDGDP